MVQYIKEKLLYKPEEKFQSLNSIKRITLEICTKLPIHGYFKEERVSE